MGKGIKAIMTMITAHAGQAYTPEWQVLIGQVDDHVINAASAEGNPLQEKVLLVFVIREVVSGERFFSFRDHFHELAALGVAHLYGLSTQDTTYQQEAADRLHLPFPILSDARLAFTTALTLPTFAAAGMTLLKRMALVVDDGFITKVFYPVFPPDKNAAEVIAWIQASR